MIVAGTGARIALLQDAHHNMSITAFPGGILMKRLTTTACLLAMLLASALATADGLQPGLWEIRTTTLIDGQALPTLEEMMKDVPPHMREQMKGMMANSGVDMGSGAIRICVSPEKATRQSMPAMDSDPNCQTDIEEKDKYHWTFRMECQNPQRSGEGETHLVSDTLWKSRISMSQTENRKTQQMETETEGRWIGSDCGGLKPQR
ncbi:MAG: DUF3617 domain-containing protein [Gammaproteobacteria bacterium]|nr:MAG: DUF3617 domain-containing protein [Gammaproteobacteria bacterium]